MTSRRTDTGSHAVRSSQIHRASSREAALWGIQFVYYARRMGFVKIGYTASMAERVRHLRITWTDLLAVEYGDMALEKARHEQFAASRVTGEGLGREHYRLTPDLAEHIETLRQSMLEWRLGVSLDIR